MNIRKLILCIIIPVIVVCCADEEISWDVEEAPEMLVVEGRITNEIKTHTIMLSKTANYFSNEKTPVVSNATVSISSGATYITYQETPPGTGIYETVNEVGGTPGNTYTVDINLKEEISGLSHYSATSEMQPGLVLDSIEAFIYENPFYTEEGVTDSLLIVIVAYGFEPKEINNIYQLNLYKNNQLINDTIDETYLIRDSEEFEGSYVNTFYFFEEFKENDTVGFEVLSVDEGYMQFITGVNNLANQSVDPFDLSGPPANAIGNIEHGKGIGYFLASQVSRVSTLAIDYSRIESADTKLKIEIKMNDYLLNK
jgi:hypothetical protein